MEKKAAVRGGRPRLEVVGDGVKVEKMNGVEGFLMKLVIGLEGVRYVQTSYSVRLNTSDRV